MCACDNDPSIFIKTSMIIEDGKKSMEFEIEPLILDPHTTVSKITDSIIRRVKYYYVKGKIWKFSFRCI